MSDTSNPSDSDFAPRIRLATTEAVAAHYVEHLGDACTYYPAIRCDLTHLARLKRACDLLWLFRPDIHAKLWIVREPDDRFLLTSELDPAVADAFHELAQAGAQFACVRPVDLDLREYAAALRTLLRQRSSARHA